MFFPAKMQQDHQLTQLKLQLQSAFMAAPLQKSTPVQELTSSTDNTPDATTDTTPSTSYSSSSTLLTSAAESEYNDDDVPVSFCKSIPQRRASSSSLLSIMIRNSPTKSSPSISSSDDDEELEIRGLKINKLSNTTSFYRKSHAGPGNSSHLIDYTWRARDYSKITTAVYGKVGKKASKTKDWLMRDFPVVW